MNSHKQGRFFVNRIKREIASAGVVKRKLEKRLKKSVGKVPAGAMLI